MIRDDEIGRLVKYAQGLGLQVRFKPYVRNSKAAADWTTDGTELTVYSSPRDPKIEKIMSLIHELGHHRGFIENNRQFDPKVEEALNDEENKKNRGRILDYERADSAHWDQIYKDTNCQFNIKRLYRQREFDIWQYEVYYDTGEFPTEVDKRDKKRQLKRKYGT